jgi:hypothetical protein
MAEIAQFILMFFVLPLWILVGLADWLCHRKSKIELNAGPTESVFHLLGRTELGIPVLCALLLEINALVIAIMLAAFIAHAVTLWLDVRYATTTREILPIEQSVHNYMEGLPLLGLGVIVLLQWGQFAALFGFVGKLCLRVEAAATSAMVSSGDNRCGVVAERRSLRGRIV